MNCPNCGKESVEGAKFCESCGAPLVSEVSEPAAPVPPAPASPFNAPEPSMPVGTNTAQSSAPQAPAQMQSGYAPYEPPAQPYGTQNGYAAPMPIRSRVTTPSPTPRNKTPTRMHTKHRMASLRTKAHTMARFTQCPIPIAHCASLTSSCALFRPSPAPF